MKKLSLFFVLLSTLQLHGKIVSAERIGNVILLGNYSIFSTQKNTDKEINTKQQLALLKGLRDGKSSSNGSTDTCVLAMDIAECMKNKNLKNKDFLIGLCGKIRALKNPNTKVENIDPRDVLLFTERKLLQNKENIDIKFNDILEEAYSIKNKVESFFEDNSPNSAVKEKLNIINNYENTFDKILKSLNVYAYIRVFDLSISPFISRIKSLNKKNELDTKKLKNPSKEETRTQKKESLKLKDQINFDTKFKEKIYDPMMYIVLLSVQLYIFTRISYWMKKCKTIIVCMESEHIQEIKYLLTKKKDTCTKNHWADGSYVAPETIYEIITQEPKGSFL